MQKNIYSLLLTDEIINEIDRIAYENSTSRSNMVNQILAEYISYTTPEQNMRDVFTRIESILVSANSFQPVLQPSLSMYSIRSSLDYKYNPTVKYCVELCTDRSEYLGELRVSVRSQSESFKLLLLQFFKLWMKLEKVTNGNSEATIDEDKYIKRLYLCRNIESNDEIGESIAEYIRTMNHGLNTFLKLYNRPDSAIEKVNDIYHNYILTDPIIL